jgi:L-gulonolactone oxidase
MRPIHFPIRCKRSFSGGPGPEQHHSPLGRAEQPKQRDANGRLTVHTERDIVQAVVRARESGTTLRAMGSGGSKNGNFRTRGCALDLHAYASLISVDGNHVTVQAGMTVAMLQAMLASEGLALATPGEWNGATVAGAISTGTHGGSLRHGCFATSISTIRLVTGSGAVLTLERGNPEFRHAGVSLGAMGVLSELTFECSPQFHLQLERRLVTFDRFLCDHDRKARTHEFSSAAWFPGAGYVLTYEADRCAQPVRSTRRRQRYDFSSSLLSSFPCWGRVPEPMAGRLLHDVAWGSSAEMLSPMRKSGQTARLLRRLAPRVREVEFAVPFEHGGETLASLERLLRQWPRALLLPVGIRATAADGFSLSPCSDRDVLWVSTFYADNEAFTAALADLFVRFGARCHWGKNIALSPLHLRSQYPHWNAFASARSSFDPSDVFTNWFTEEYIQ